MDALLKYTYEKMKKLSNLRKANGVNDLSIDPYEDNQWPSWFNIHEVEDIPIGQLNELPNVQKTVSVKEFIQAEKANLNMTLS